VCVLPELYEAHCKAGFIQTFQRISLPSFPRSLTLLESKKESEIVIGLKEGGLMRINSLEPEQRVRYEGIVNNSVDRITPIRGKNWLVLSHPSAITIYSND
jgi:hypothetical protein